MKTEAERLTEIENRYSHLERYVDELNGVVVAQSQLIDSMRRELARLSERVLAHEGSAETPPHY